jgi:hypothetical protein
MRNTWRFATIAALTVLVMLGSGSSQGMAQSRGHVYLLRGLMNIFSLGMDTLSEELQKRGVNATVHGYGEWQSLADQAAARYRAGTEGPIILIGHSLGADAVMEMADYLDRKGIPVALVIPFDGTQSFATPKNVGRLVNLTQRDYAYMKRGPGFHGSLANVDVSGDPNIGHISIDKSPRMHARAISEVLAVLGSGHRAPAPPSAAKSTAVNHHAPGGEEEAVKPAPTTGATVKPEGSPETPAKPGNGAMNETDMKPLADSGMPAIAVPERHSAGASANVPKTQRRPAAPVDSASPMPN